jgi:hypothetical protein
MRNRNDKVLAAHVRIPGDADQRSGLMPIT